MPNEVVQEIPLSRIHEDPQNPRKLFGDVDLLAKSIDTQGQIEPAILRPHTKDGDYFIVAGARRFRAHQKLGRKTMPCIVRAISEREALEQMIVENAHREDVNAIELSDSFGKMRDELKMTAEQIAARVQLKISYVYDVLHLYEHGLEPLKKAVLKGDLGLVSAVWISRAKGERLQNAALADALKLKKGDEPPPARAVKKLIQEKYLQRHTGTSRSAKRRHDAHAEKAAEVALRRLVVRRLLNGVAGLVERKHHLDETDMRLMALASAEAPPTEATTREVYENRGVKPTGLARVGAAQLRSLVVELAVAAFASLDVDGDYSAGTKTVARTYGLSLAEIEKAVEATSAAEALFKKE
jgi:ParB/RepB/Spo0J family partition protein